MKYFWKILILLYLFFVGCNNGTKKEIFTTDSQLELKKIELDQMPVNSFNSLFTLEAYVVLKTPFDSPIGEVSKVILADNKIFVLDKAQDCIFIFDKSGNHLNLIQNKGRGPTEYISLDDISWDKNTNVLSAIDRGGKRFFYYTENGTYLSHTKLDFKPFAFFDNGDYYWFYTGNYGTMSNYDKATKNHYSLLYTDTIFDVKQKNKLINEGFLGYSFSNSNVSSFAAIKDKLMYTEFYSNTIQELSNGMCYDKYLLNFGDKAIPLKTQTLTSPIEFPKVIIEGEYSYVQGCYSLDKYLVVECNEYYILINTKTDEAKKFSRYDNIIKTSTKYLTEDTQHGFAVFNADLWDASFENSDTFYKEIESILQTQSYSVVLMYYRLIE